MLPAQDAEQGRGASVLQLHLPLHYHGRLCLEPCPGVTGGGVHPARVVMPERLPMRSTRSALALWGWACTRLRLQLCSGQRRLLHACRAAWLGMPCVMCFLRDVHKCGARCSHAADKHLQLRLAKRATIGLPEPAVKPA